MSNDPLKKNLKDHYERIEVRPEMRARLEKMAEREGEKYRPRRGEWSPLWDRFRYSTAATVFVTVLVAGTIFVLWQFAAVPVYRLLTNQPDNSHTVQVVVTEPGVGFAGDDEKKVFADEPLDLNPASLPEVRAALREGRLPPSESVRIVSMVNYFDYDVPAGGRRGYNRARRSRIGAVEGGPSTRQTERTGGGQRHRRDRCQRLDDRCCFQLARRGKL
ncbi:MAG: von Willebrand factor type A domain-containing protein [Deltaproteobacteria bacterium]|nr:von Willebrand factor type A domain-containing protein [Deltaproteobacteria bacterium]